MRRKEACWLMEFEGFYNVIYSTEMYDYVKREKKDFGGHKLTKETYFEDIKECRKKYPKINKYGF